MENKALTVKPASANVLTLARNGHEMKNLATYDEFILWFALPGHEKIKMGLPTQDAFATYHGLNIKTTTRWKQRQDFLPRVTDLRKQWAQERSSDVIAAIYKSSIKGNPLSQKLWMQMYEGFTEKQEIKHTTQVDFGINDVRFLIQGLPEPLRTQHYANLRQLLDDSTMVRNAGQIEDGNLSDRYQDAIPGEAHHDAPNLPSPKANRLANRNKAGVCEDLVWPSFAHNYQGAARWW